MLTVQYRSTLQPRVSEKQSRIIEHKRMAAIARDERLAAEAHTRPARPGVLARLLGRRPAAAPDPEVTIWLDPVAGTPWAAAAEAGAVPAVAVARPAPAVVEPARRVVA